MLNKVSWQQALLSPRAYWVWYAVLALPFIGLVWALFQDALGANPAEALSRASGDWTLRLLCLVLAISPLRNASLALSDLRHSWYSFHRFPWPGASTPKPEACRPGPPPLAPLATSSASTNRLNAWSASAVRRSAAASR